MIPFRLCCGQQHLGPQCPDGRVMCCLCFDVVQVDQLAEEEGQKIDVCIPCKEHENEQMRKRGLV